MKQFQVLVIPILFFSLFVNGQTTSLNSVLQKGWETFNDSNYSISYPENWEFNTNVQEGINFMILSRLSSSTDLFRENINLITQDLGGRNIALETYVEISESQVKKLIPNSNLIESSKKKKNGLEYQKVLYTGDQGGYKLKFEQYCWIKNGKAYVLTFTSEKDQFEDFKDVGEKILNSFSFK